MPGKTYQYLGRTHLACAPPANKKRAKASGRKPAASHCRGWHRRFKSLRHTSKEPRPEVGGTKGCAAGRLESVRASTWKFGSGVGSAPGAPGREPAYRGRGMPRPDATRPCSKATKTPQLPLPVGSRLAAGGGDNQSATAMAMMRRPTRPRRSYSMATLLRCLPMMRLKGQCKQG